jgi:hypothetical protein
MSDVTKAVIRYDWIRMKQEFVISPHSEVYTFLREEYGLDANSNGAVSKRVRGWSDESRI